MVVFFFYNIFINKIKFMKKVIRLTESDLMRIVKRVISEQSLGDKPSFDKNWLKTLSGLKNFNNPKVINFKYEGEPVTSLNWGIHSDQGRKKNWGLSLSSDNSLSFQTKDEIQSKVFQTVMGLKPEFNSLSKSYSYNGDVGFSNSSELISKIKKIILSLG